MNKKFTIALIMIFALSSVVLPMRKERADLYNKAIGEKEANKKLALLEEYLQKYGKKEDKYLKYIFLNLTYTTFALKKYDKSIEYGEKTLTFQEIDDTSKIRIFLYLANSYYVTSKDLDKAIEYAGLVTELAK